MGNLNGISYLGPAMSEELRSLLPEAKNVAQTC